MNSNRQNEIAVALVRAALGAVLLAHGLLKIFVFTLPGAAAFFASVGFPGWTAYIVAPLEVVTGAALIAGFGVRWAALAALPVLAGSALVHAGNGWLFSNANGGWEFPVLLVVLDLAVIAAGQDRFGLARRLPEAAPRSAHA